MFRLGQASGKRCKCRRSMKLSATGSVAPDFGDKAIIQPAINRYSTTSCERHVAHKPHKNEQFTQDVTCVAGATPSGSRHITLGEKKCPPTLPFKFSAR